METTNNNPSIVKSYSFAAAAAEFGSPAVRENFVNSETGEQFTAITFMDSTKTNEDGKHPVRFCQLGRSMQAAGLTTFAAIQENIKDIKIGLMDNGNLVAFKDNSNYKALSL